MSRILGIVVLYHPERELIHHISTYLGGVEKVLLIDNSEQSPPWLPASVASLGEKVSLLKNPENMGIAKALNQGARWAIENKSDWLLTMDQDSYFEQGALHEMKTFIGTAPAQLALLTPFHLTPKASHKNITGVKRLRMTMTSGNLVRLSAYQLTGPFEEKLFIDSVDHEYCLRLRKNGFTILRLNNAILHHQLGEIVYHRFLFLRLKTTNHSALRRYYIIRNRLYVMFKYFPFDLKFFFREFNETIKSFLAVWMFEEDKGKKTKAMLTGAWHFMIGRYGKR